MTNQALGDAGASTGPAGGWRAKGTQVSVLFHCAVIPASVSLLCKAGCLLCCGVMEGFTEEVTFNLLFEG